MNRSEAIRVTTLVAADPATAFEIFTADVDAWWKRGPRFRPALRGDGALRFEPRVGGRLLETYQDGSEFEFGRITIWEPGKRLKFEFFGRAFAPGEATEVEVLFDAAGENTRVTVEHRGWERFSKDHPARHGLGKGAFNDVMGIWWADLFVSLKTSIADRSTPRTQ